MGSLRESVQDRFCLSHHPIDNVAATFDFRDAAAPLPGREAGQPWLAQGIFGMQKSHQAGLLHLCILLGKRLNFVRALCPFFDGWILQGPQGFARPTARHDGVAFRVRKIAS